MRVLAQKRVQGPRHCDRTGDLQYRKLADTVDLLIVVLDVLDHLKQNLVPHWMLRC